MISILELIVPLLAGTGGIVTFLLEFYKARRKEEETRQKIDSIEEKADREPEKIRYAWDLARIKLEAYFDRNLTQVNAIFWVSVFVMAIGFGFILFGIVRSMNDPKTLTPSYVGAISGIVTEFISVSFMLIYRSTLKGKLLHERA